MSIEYLRTYVLCRDAMKVMSATNQAWVLVRFENGSHQFFDYMDFNHKLISMSQKMTSTSTLSDVVERMSSMPVGALANCSGYCSFKSLSADAPVSDFLRLGVKKTTRLGLNRRIPIVDSTNEVLLVATQLDFLKLALK